MSKMKRKILCVVFAVCLVVSSLVFSTAAVDTERYGRTVLQRMDNSSSLLKAYDKISAGCRDSHGEIYLTGIGCNISGEELSLVMKYIEADYPEYFWMEGAYSYTPNASGRVQSVAPHYVMQGAALDVAKANFNAVVERLTAGLASRSDYKKTKILHDRLIALTVYRSDENRYNAYGALCDGYAVCEGYARAYQVLLNAVGIQAWTVMGESNRISDGVRVAHAWNLVKVSGDWYYTDVTWDDNGNSANEIFYSYLNITTDQLLEDHVLAEDFARAVPYCNATDANYFTVNGGKYNSFDFEQLVQQIKNDSTVLRLYTTADINSFRNDVLANLFSAANQAGLSGNISYTAKYCRREALLVLSLDSCSHSGDKTWEYDDEYHWRACNCRTLFNYDIHKDSDGNGRCDLCYYSMFSTYTLRYNANGGIGAPATQSFSLTLTLSSSIPVRSGYTFIGWSANENAMHASYSPGETITLTSDMTLYAVWLRNDTDYRTVSYNANGGTGAPPVHFGAASYTISPGIPVREGYVFLGWSESADAVSPTYKADDIIVPQYDTVLYAVWAEKGASDCILSIQVPSVFVISYGDTLVLHAKIKGELPKGAKILWDCNSSAVVLSSYDDMTECSVTSLASGEVTVTATLADENNKPILNADGEKITDYIELTSKAGFFQKLLSFLKSLFRISRVILQSDYSA